MQLGPRLKSTPERKASPQLSTRRLHVTHMVPTQYPVAHAVTTSAHRAPAALQKPPWMCATPYAAGRPGATAWAHADAAYSALARAGRPRQEPRKVGPQRRPQKRQPSLGSHGGKSRRRQPTAGCAAGWNRPTRLELLDDLESRAIREVSGRRCSYGDAEPSAASPYQHLAHRSAPVEGTRERTLSVCGKR